jgi:hypothetical protein
MPELKGNPLADMLNRMMRPRDKKKFFEIVDQLGNLRMDRASFAVIPDGNSPDKTRLFARFTGKGDRKRLLDYLRKEFRELKDAAVSERKGPDGEPVTVLDNKLPGPTFAVIGDTDFLLAGYAGGRTGHLEVLEEALKVQMGKSSSLLTGPYAGTLKGISTKASGLLIGDLPEMWRQAATQGRNSPFHGFVQNFNVVLTRTAKGVKVRFTGGAANAKEAKGFMDGVNRVKQLALDGLKQLPPFIKIKPKTLDAVRGVVKSVRVEAKDALLTGGAFISNEAARASFDFVALAFMGVSSEKAVPAAKP